MYVGDFKLKGSALRTKGINRTGNLLVPNNNYCKFEEWLMPILDRMLEEQISQVCVYFVDLELECMFAILCEYVYTHCSMYKYIACGMWFWYACM